MLSYWNRIRGDNDFPSIVDVNVEEILEMWHYCFVIDLVCEEGHQFQYFGPELATIFDHDYSGELLEEALKDTVLEHTVGFYPKVCQRRAPVSESSSFYLDGKEVRYRSLIVPLSNDQQEISHIIGTTNYKIFD